MSERVDQVLAAVGLVAADLPAATLAEVARYIDDVDQPQPAADMNARLRGRASEPEPAAEKDADVEIDPLNRLRVEVAKARNLPAELIGSLTGETIGELLTQCDDLIAKLEPPRPPAVKVPQGPRGPAPEAPDMNQQLRTATGRTFT